jgi:hypothetical protein
MQSSSIRSEPWRALNEGESSHLVVIIGFDRWATVISRRTRLHNTLAGEVGVGAVNMETWHQRSRLPVAVLVDVDGTLAGIYRSGRRNLRPSAVAALEILSREAPVFLWSIAGAENGWRLLQEFPALAPLVSGCFGKDEFPLHLVDVPFAIDDECVDEVVLECRYVFVETHDEGRDSDSLLGAARVVVAAIQARRP